MNAPLPETSLTQALAHYVAGGHSRKLAPAALELIRQGFIDTVAVIVAGRHEPVVQRLRAYLRKQNPDASGPCQVLFESQGYTVHDAAWLNATAGHALDYDDVGLQGHPSVVLVPALLAEGERRGAPALELMQAYHTGYEVWAELISRDTDLHHLKGWHPTAVFGVVAVAAAICTLRRLPPEICIHALGLAATQAGGLVANFGSMAKPLHAGLAAMNGIKAVDLAQAGITTAPDALEHHAGFLAAVSPAGRVDRQSPIPDLATQPRLLTLGLSLKKYPMCFATHRIIDAALDLTRQHNLQADQIAQVTTQVGKAQASMLRNHRPATGLEAKFSMEFAVAAAVIARQVGLAQLNDAFVQRSDIQGFMPKVHTNTVDTINPAEPSLALADEIDITLNDGRIVRSGPVFHARGTPHAPLHAGELEAKFRDCTRELPSSQSDYLWNHLATLESLPDIRQLVPL